MKGVNITLKKNIIFGTHDPKIIDFGAGVTDFQELLALSPFYFYNGSTRTEKMLEFLKF